MMSSQAKQAFVFLLTIKSCASLVNLVGVTQELNGKSTWEITGNAMTLMPMELSSDPGCIESISLRFSFAIQKSKGVHTLWLEKENYILEYDDI